MTDDARKLNALIRLGIARQAPMDTPSQKVYLEELAHVPAEVIERVCQHLARRPKGDYEPAFPAVGTVLELCGSILRQRLIQSDTQRYLDAPTRPSLSREEAKAWVEQLKADVERARGKRLDGIKTFPSRSEANR